MGSYGWVNEQILNKGCFKIGDAGFTMSLMTGSQKFAYSRIMTSNLSTIHTVLNDSKIVIHPMFIQLLWKIK